MGNKYLNCPVRGELKYLEKSKDGFTFTEEYRRIECVKFLLKKGYPKENFDFETNVLKYGNKGRNTLRADIIAYDKPKLKVAKNKVEHITLICEIKRDKEDLSSAIEHQLKPALNHTPNSKYGIYWDNENRLLFRKTGFTEHNITKLPLFTSEWEDKEISFDVLEPINDSKALLKLLEQKIHNVGGTNKDFRYKEIFKIILAKYYDEMKNKNNKFMEFQVFSKEKNNKKELLKRFNKLYQNAKDYYSSNSPISLEDNLKLNEKILSEMIKVLEGFSFNLTSQLLLQDFFMYFAPTFLKKDLDQYYTPQEIVNFMSSIININNVDCAIDCSGGSADFLTGIMKKGMSKGLDNIKENIHYWDISQDAGNVASLNMILNGDGRTNIDVIDSIESYDKKNNFFQIAITNPPFGQETIWEKDLSVMDNYVLGHKFIINKEDNKMIKSDELIRQQLGILFIERNINLLKKGGILEIILPNGYLTNRSQKYIRKYLLDNFKIIGLVTLPEDVFKKSDASGVPVILIVKKEKINTNYKIFTAVVKNIGFKHTSNKQPPIYLRDKKTGKYLLDKDNNEIPKNDLLLFENQFKKFAFDNNINGFEQEDINEIDYSFTTKNTISADKDLIFCAQRSDNSYLDILKKIKEEEHTTLTKLNAEVQNTVSFNKRTDKEYIYLDTRQLFTGQYKRENKLMGWELPGRAKQSLKKNDILIAKVRGCFDKFCIILEDNDSLIGSNAFWRIRIEDEKERLNLYHFLHTSDYKKQMEALATGTILLDVKEEDLIEKLLIPKNDIDKNYEKMKGFLKVQEDLIK